MGIGFVGYNTPCAAADSFGFGVGMSAGWKHGHKELFTLGGLAAATNIAGHGSHDIAFGSCLEKSH
jgi:hypothetical protein